MHVGLLRQGDFDAVEQLFGREPPQRRRAIITGLLRLVDIEMVLERRIVAQLIGPAGEDQPNGVLKIVAVAQEIVGEPIEQFRMAGRMIEPEIILGLEQAQTEIALPKPVDDGFGKARIERVD